MKLATSFSGYADLSRAQTEGAHYRIFSRPMPGSNVAVIAPHGGKIETPTSEIARCIAGSDLNLYLFEGIRTKGNYDALHLTSHRFDEPICLELIAPCDYVLAIHGCEGEEQSVLLGGLDNPLKSAIGDALAISGVAVHHSGHRFPARDPMNICNRGRRGVGAQVELTRGIRAEGKLDVVCDAIRKALLKISGTRDGSCARRDLSEGS